MTTVREEIAPQLLFSSSPKILTHLKSRAPQRIYPIAKNSGFKASQLLEFELRSDSLVDVNTACLNFDLAFDTASTQLANAIDIIQDARLYLNEVEVEQILGANTLSNLLLYYSMNETYIKSEGDVYLGYTSKRFQASNNKSRSYTIPLSIVFGLFRSSQSLIPMFGNRLRIQFTLATDAKVVNYAVNDTDTYTLNNVNLTYDEVLVSDQFRKVIMDAMSSSKSIRIPFTSAVTQTLNLGTSSSFFGRLTFNLSNVLSLHMLVDDTAKDTREASKYIFNRQAYPLQGFQKVFVRAGSQNITPADGLKNYVELFKESNKTISNFNDYLGQGVLRYSDLSEGYARAATIGDVSCGVCPISLDCSKIISSDDAVVNQGLSSSQISEFQIELYKSTAFKASENLYTALVHKKAIVFSDSGVMVES